MLASSLSLSALSFKSEMKDCDDAWCLLLAFLSGGARVSACVRKMLLPESLEKKKKEYCRHNYHLT